MNFYLALHRVRLKPRRGAAKKRRDKEKRVERVDGAKGGMCDSLRKNQLNVRDKSASLLTSIEGSLFIVEINFANWKIHVVFFILRTSPDDS